MVNTLNKLSLEHCGKEHITALLANRSPFPETVAYINFIADHTIIS